ncbi:MAG: HlyC/CorC family transporter [Ignavibacteria bacterium]|nr:MAG: HlyC/CorC family transporter [Ignavibacteria bacterium]
MVEELILLILLLFLSGFFSGTEMAYIVSSKLKMEIKARKKNPAAVSAHYFKSHPQTFFSTVLIGNNVVNVALSSLSAVFLSAIFGLGELNILLISSFLLLLFGELLPKYFASEIADKTFLLTALPLRIFSIMIFPFVKAASTASEKLTQSTSIEADALSHLFDKEEIKELVKESHEAGVVDKKESDIIEKVIELGEQRAYETMTPRTDIIGVEINQTIKEALTIFIDSGFSKLPVYEDNLDNIKGIILAKDIFKSPQSLKSIIREVSFMPETKKSFDVMNEFLDKKISIAIVIDEFGGTAGIVTMEDILEELFGEIKDEFDVDEDICRRITPNSYIISGKVELDHINEKYELNIEEGDYETIAGYIISKLGRIPAQGETVEIDNYTILIARAASQKVELVKLTKNTD